MAQQEVAQKAGGAGKPGGDAKQTPKTKQALLELLQTHLIQVLYCGGTAPYCTRLSAGEWGGGRCGGG